MILQSVLLLLSAAPTGEPTSPLKGCRATPYAGRGWQYDCEQLRALVEDKEDVRASDLDGLQAAAAVLVGDGSRKTREQGMVSGESVEFRRAHGRDKNGSAWVTSLARPPGARVLFCVALGSTDPCGVVMAELAATPWRGDHLPGTVLEELPPLTLAGRPVQIPSGCKGTPLVGGARIACPPAFFANWTTVVDEDVGRRAMAEFREAIAAKLPGSKQDGFSCKLSGVATTCGRLRANLQGNRIVVLSAVAPVDGQMLLGYCMGIDDVSIRQPCSVLFGQR